MEVEVERDGGEVAEEEVVASIGVVLVLAEGGAGLDVNGESDLLRLDGLDPLLSRRR